MELVNFSKILSAPLEVETPEYPSGSQLMKMLPTSVLLQTIQLQYGNSVL